MKLWQKNNETGNGPNKNEEAAKGLKTEQSPVLMHLQQFEKKSIRSITKEIEAFTVGNDYILDQKLIKYDCIASIAHARMLHKIGLLTENELGTIIKGLNDIIDHDAKGTFRIKQSDEDGHTAIENYLTDRYGEVGKKIHTARSRNDQVLAAIRLYEKHELQILKRLIKEMIHAIAEKNSEIGNIKIPGYTHTRKAMPTDIKTWLGSFGAAAEDNIDVLNNTLRIIDQSPLGSAAGFGVPVLNIDRDMTAEMMGFARVQENPMYVQLSRGKFEAEILHCLTQIMLDLNKLATDLLLFSTEEFGFITIPEELCTGSSIMPHKKNPDVLELIRGKYHIIIAEEFKIKSMIGNLMSGYNRDMQLTKESLITSIETTKDCLKIIGPIIRRIKANEERCKASMTDELLATEEAYKLVETGMPFRDAYREVAKKY